MISSVSGDACHNAFTASHSREKIAAFTRRIRNADGNVPCMAQIARKPVNLPIIGAGRCNGYPVKIVRFKSPTDPFDAARICKRLDFFRRLRTHQTDFKIELQKRAHTPRCHASAAYHQKDASAAGREQWKISVLAFICHSASPPGLQLA